MGDNTQTSTSTTGSSNPHVNSTLNGLLDQVDSIRTAGPQVYNHSLYAGVGPNTQRAWDASIGNAADPGYNGAVHGATSFANNLIGGGGLSSVQHDAIQGLDSLYSGYGGVGQNGGLNGGQQNDVSIGNMVGNQFGQMGQNGGLQNGQLGDLSSQRALGGQYGALSGAYGQDSPGYQALRSNIADTTLSGINAGQGVGGRLGSSVAGEAAGRGVANALAGLDYNNYQNNVNNQYRSLDSQQGALGNAFGMAQQGVNNRMGALQGQLGAANQTFGQQQQGTNNILSSLAGRQGVLGQQFDMGQQGINNSFGASDRLPGLFASLMAPAGVMGQVGAAQDADRQAQLSGDADLYGRQHNASLNHLRDITGAFGGLAGAGGQTTVNSQPGTPWWQSLLGGGVGLLGLLGG